MKKSLFLLAVTLCILASCKPNRLQLNTDNMILTLDNKGNISSITGPGPAENYIDRSSSASPLLSILTDTTIIKPVKATWSKREMIKLFYPDNISATIEYKNSPSHLSFRLKSLSDSVSMIIWGPYNTTISETIGETVGVVRDSLYAIGLQSLNPKTLGGYPWNDNDCMPQIDIFEQDDPTDMSEKGKRYVLYRVEAASPTKTGSSLQAYCRDRSKPRIITNWGHAQYISPSFADGGVTGSAIALFGCPAGKALETIGKIETEEGLPHPLIKGEWGKTSVDASSAYIIMDFGEDDIDRAIEITKQAGLKHLYQSGPFETWGHFELRPDKFPNGREGMKMCVEKAAAEGITVGVHTLSNFITTNDEYVTPVPDPRLAIVGFSTLTDNIDENQETITIESPDFFMPGNNDYLHTIRIGNELVKFDSVGLSQPYTLTGCKRGAWGTQAAAHNAGDTASRLADHGYKVFLTNPGLSIEVAQNIAAFFNDTGMRQISFDGLEGNRSTGMGNYGEILFTTSWYDSISPPIKENFIADASRTSHYFWHIYSRMNWGEPWYAGFRESQTDYRIKNQAYFSRNLMPAMLGWFRMTSETTAEDIEWMLARSAAYNAGYAFVVDRESLENNRQTDTILSLIGLWEKTRMEGKFTPAQRENMKDLNREFHLGVNEEGKPVLEEK